MKLTERHTRVSLDKIFGSRIALHVYFWIAVILYTGVLLGYPSRLMDGIWHGLMVLPVDMIIIYTILYFLIPKLLLRKRYLLFVVLVILLAFVDEFLIRFLWAKVYFPGQNLPYLKWDQINPMDLLTDYYHIGAAIAIKLFKVWNKENKESLASEKARHEIELKLKEAEVKLLKAQLHPHFLFNTLNSLYGLTLSGSKKSPQVVLKISALLDYMLYQCNVPEVSVKKEIEHIRNYVDLEQLRYNTNLEIRISDDGNYAHLKIAPLLLLPFVENSFKHGVSSKASGNFIHMEFKMIGKSFVFDISNSKKPKSNTDSSGYSEGIGLKNVQRRLDLNYKNRYVLNIQDEETQFSVNLNLDLS